MNPTGPMTAPVVTKRLYVVSDVTDSAMLPVPVRALYARTAAHAASAVVGEGAVLVRMRWCDSGRRDHILATVRERDGRVWTLRAMTVVPEAA